MSGESVKARGGIKPKKMGQLLATVKYELLWNVRKKKFIGAMAAAFAITTLTLILPVVLRSMNNMLIEDNPNYVVSNSGIGSLMLFLFALVTVMNSVSGEFESGTIVTLLTKPVSRTLIFMGKVIAAVTTILAAYTILYLYMVIGGTLIYGPQNNLNLIPLSFLADVFSTIVWMSIILAIGSLSKNTILTAVAGIIIFLSMNVGSSIISVFTESSWVLHYLPGSGATGYVKTPGQTAPAGSLSTGTDNIAKIVVQYMLNPSANITYVKVELGGRPQESVLSLFRELYSEPLSLVLYRSLTVAALYITTLMLLGWISFKRAQILE